MINSNSSVSGIIITDNYSAGHGGGIFVSAGANINLQQFPFNRFNLDMSS